MDGIYLDSHATTRPLPEVREAIVGAMAEPLGNPSSAHASGEQALEAVEKAREQVADLLGAEPSNLRFVSGCTEANNVVIQSAHLWESKPRRVVTSAVEHASVRRPFTALADMGYDVVEINVDSLGCLSLVDIEECLQRGARLVSIQWVNNETGVIQPIDEIGNLCRQYGALFHTDAAQAIGKVPFQFRELPVDFMTFSGHKFHAPLGTGGIVAQEPELLRPLMFGGEQEGGLRPGTENVPALVGLGVAAEARRIGLSETLSRLAILRDRLERQIMAYVPGVMINGSKEHRVGSCSNLRFPGVDGQALAVQLDLRGIRCSQSSACTSSRPEPSHVLRAMGLSEAQAYASLRFSVSVENSELEMDEAARAVAEAFEALSAFDTESNRLAIRIGGL